VRALYVPIDDRARDALLVLSERQYRRPRDQAALLLVDALRRCGVLADDAEEPSGDLATPETRIAASDLTRRRR
jgi:hypothetical protein